jgi:hypothetical protein
MALLSPDYYANAINTAPPAPAAGPSPLPETSTPVQPAPTPAPTPVAPPSAPGAIQPSATPATLDTNPIIDTVKRLGPLGVIGGAIGAIGGPVGIAAGALAGSSIGSAIQYPDQATWDGMSIAQKIGYVGGQASAGLVNMALNLPKAVVRGVASVGVTALKPTYNLLTGKPADFNTLANEPKVSAPWIGEIPTYYSDVADSMKSGVGPLASAFFASSNLGLNTAMVLPVGEVLANTFRPKASTATPGVIENTAPITAIRNADGGVAVKTPSTSEYYTLRKTDAAQFGGNSSTIQWKFTPASEGQTSLAVVKQVPKNTAIGSWIKTDFGLKQVTQGNFGPEIKLWDHTADTTVKPNSVQSADAMALENTKLHLSFIEDAMAGHPGAGAGKYLNWRTGEFLKGADGKYQGAVGQEASGGGDLNTLVEQQKEYQGLQEQAVQLKASIKDLQAKVKTPTTNESSDPFANVAPSVDMKNLNIPSRVDPGFENKPVTPAQIKTLNDIATVKGMDPSLRDAVIQRLSGKDVIGEMTQKQFVDIAQSLGKYGEAYVTKTPGTGPIGFGKMWVAPQRHAFDYAEDTYGIPLKSAIYNPMEDAARLSKVLKTNLNNDIAENVFGGGTATDLTKSKYIAERKLVDSYARGNPDAILKNDTLTPDMKTLLVDTAKKLIAWDEKNGVVLNVGKEAYLDNYGGPKIANISGTTPKYKDLSKFPAKTFFAKEKREGSLNPFIDDPLASRQIYIKQGADALHYGPALDNIKPLLDAIPAEYKVWKDAANSYIQEKLGYQGSIEKFVDSFVPALNRNLAKLPGKFAVELPADTSRQVVNYGLSSLYSGLVGTPKAMFQQFFQYPLFVYPKLGPEFAAEAIKKSFDPAETARISAGGWLNDISLPYGEALANEITPAGKVGNAFKTFTQETIKPLSFVDNRIRVQTFLQAEMKWNAALNQFNGAKIDWPTLESKLDFGSFSQTDRNSMRQALTSQNNEAAFNIYMRENLDEANVSYRTASGARVGYGLAGKLSTGLLNYTIETTNVLARWAGTGQWDKLVRFAGAAKATNDTMKETFGMDFGNTIYQKFNGITSPVVGLVGAMYSYFNAMTQNNRKDMNTNQDAIIRTLKSGVPLGVAGRNAASFWKSIQAGPDANGMYGIYDDAGRLTYNSDFNDLFWGSLMGFPTKTKMDERNLYTDLINAQTQNADTKQQVDQLLREGKYDEMQSLILKTGVLPSSGAMQKYYTPRAQQMFQSLPGNLKSQFAPRVFPSAFSGVQ